MKVYLLEFNIHKFSLLKSPYCDEEDDLVINNNKYRINDLKIAPVYNTYNNSLKIRSKNSAFDLVDRELNQLSMCYMKIHYF